MRTRDLSLCFILMLGCQDSSLGQGGPGPADLGTSPIDSASTSPAMVGDFQARLLGLWCFRLVRCGVIGADEEATCRQVTDPATTPPRHDFEKAVAAGSQIFDAQAADPCLAEIEQRACGRFELTWPSLGGSWARGACAQVFRPTALPGAACAHDADCDSGSCAFSSRTCAGVCEASPPLGHDLGETCQSYDACRAGLWCKTNGSSGICIALDGREGQPCGLTELCDGGLYCGGSPNAWTCRALLPADAACTALNSCAGGLACKLVAPGEQRCAPFGDLGDACDPIDRQTCRTNLVCDPTTLRCKSRGRLGDPCGTSIEGSGNEPCAPYLRCDASKTCVLPVGQGAACNRGFISASSCAEGVCTDGLCSVPCY